jgi:glutaredoxin
MLIMFTVFSKPGCSYCDAVEKLFQIKSVPFQKKLLNVDFTRQDFLDQFGNSSFPRVLDEQGNLIGGAKETAKYLKEQGIL